MEERNGQHSANIMSQFVQITKDHPKWAKGAFMLGRYYNRMYKVEKMRLKELNDGTSQGICKEISHKAANLAFLVCKLYGTSLVFSAKYLYQTMARMLTVWEKMF